MNATIPQALAVCAAASLLLSGCERSPHAPAGDAARAELAPTQQTFWNNLRALCGQAFAGTVTADEGGAGDDAFAGRELVMHVREESP